MKVVRVASPSKDRDAAGWRVGIDMRAVGCAKVTVERAALRRRDATMRYCAAVRIARRASFVSDTVGWRLNSRIAFSPRMLRLACSEMKGKS